MRVKVGVVFVMMFMMSIFTVFGYNKSNPGPLVSNALKTIFADYGRQNFIELPTKDPNNQIFAMVNGDNTFFRVLLEPNTDGESGVIKSDDQAMYSYSHGVFFVDYAKETVKVIVYISTIVPSIDWYVTAPSHEIIVSLEGVDDRDINSEPQEVTKDMQLYEVLTTIQSNYDKGLITNRFSE